MTPIDGIVIGICGTVVVGLIAFVVTLWVRKALAVANALINGLNEIPKLRAEGEKLVKVFTDLRDEARMFRSIAMGVMPDAPPGTESAPQPPARPMAPFPAPVLDRFRVQEPADATKEESVVVDPTDEEMAQEERIQNLRDMGIPIEEPEDAEGIHVEAP